MDFSQFIVSSCPNLRHIDTIKSLLFDSILEVQVNRIKGKILKFRFYYWFMFYTYILTRPETVKWSWIGDTKLQNSQYGSLHCPISQHMIYLISLFFHGLFLMSG